jgi:hypothetical protein
MAPDEPPHPEPPSRSRYRKKGHIMRAITRAGVALTAVLAAASFTATAEAGRGFGHGGFGGHGHSFGGHGHHGFGHHHGGWGRGLRFGVYAPIYGYSDDYYDDDCYRVYRRGRYRTICD